MKEIAFVLISAVIVAGSCKSKKHISKTESTSPTEAQLTALKTRSPGATMDDLNKGHAIFYGACTNCHGTKDVTSYKEDELQKIMDKMASKAELNTLEKDAVWKYALAINLSAKK